MLWVAWENSVFVFDGFFPEAVQEVSFEESAFDFILGWWYVFKIHYSIKYYLYGNEINMNIIKVKLT
jgi:hypothetical protein